MRLKIKYKVLLLFIGYPFVNHAQNFWLQTNGPNCGTVTSINSTSANSMLCGTITGGGIFRSTNQGLIWNTVFSTPNLYEVESIVQNITGKIFAAAYYPTSVLSSTNDGITWMESGISPAFSLSAVVIPNGYIFVG